MIRRAALALATIAGCAAPEPATGIRIEDIATTRALAGTWSWRLDSGDAATTRRERETWTFAPTDDWLVVAGGYHRDVELIARDGVPFTCSQRPRYQLATDVTVRAHAAPGGAIVEEDGYRAAPSPCDPGLRMPARYQATIERGQLVLRWPGGVAHLDRVEPAGDDEAVPAPAPTAAFAPAPSGPWAWSSTSWTKSGLVQREDERWELAAGPDGALAGWYQRTVTVADPAGAPIACAGAPRYTFVDRYLVRGRALIDRSAGSPAPAESPVDDDRAGDWRLAETAVAPGVHPCLTSPRRMLDGATFDVVGDALVLTWRGRRRQVLWRPESQ